MKATVPALSPILRSNAQGDILALLFMNEGEEFSLADISRRVGALPATVHREVERLVASSILTDRMVGRARLVRANRDNRMYLPLYELLILSYGPKPVLESLLAGVEGIEQAFLFGSWAARYEGVVGAPPQDVDVLVVGTTSWKQLQELAAAAQLRLKQEVSFTRVSSDDWLAASTAFVATIRSRPIVALDIKEPG